MTLSYETIFSRARGRIDDPKELSLDPSDLLEIETERLHNVCGKPRIRRLFSSLLLDDEIQTMTFELNHSVDKYADIDFICNVLILGMAIEWLQPQVESIKYVGAKLGTKEEKVLLNNHSYSIKRLDSMKVELNKMIRDYGYLYNSYISEA